MKELNISGKYRQIIRSVRKKQKWQTSQRPSKTPPNQIPHPPSGKHNFGDQVKCPFLRGDKQQTKKRTKDGPDKAPNVGDRFSDNIKSQEVHYFRPSRSTTPQAAVSRSGGGTGPAGGAHSLGLQVVGQAVGVLVQLGGEGPRCRRGAEGSKGFLALRLRRCEHGKKAETGSWRTLWLFKNKRCERAYAQA